YRAAWRRMAGTTGFRTFYPAIIPPGAKHVNVVQSAGPIESSTHVFAGAIASSLLCDFYVRSAGISDLYPQVFENLPLPVESEAYNEVKRTFLRNNRYKREYVEFW